VPGLPPKSTPMIRSIVHGDCGNDRFITRHLRQLNSCLLLLYFARGGFIMTCADDSLRLLRVISSIVTVIVTI